MSLFSVRAVAGWRGVQNHSIKAAPRLPYHLLKRGFFMSPSFLVYLFLSPSQRKAIIENVEGLNPCVASDAKLWAIHWHEVKKGMQSMGYVVENLETRAAI